MKEETKQKLNGVKNPEVLKALVDFNIKHCENH